MTLNLDVNTRQIGRDLTRTEKRMCGDHQIDFFHQVQRFSAHTNGCIVKARTIELDDLELATDVRRFAIDIQQYQFDNIWGVFDMIGTLFCCGSWLPAEVGF